MPGLFFCQVIVDYYTFKVYTVCMAFKFFGGAFMPADSVRINFWIPKDNLDWWMLLVAVGVLIVLLLLILLV
jgi:hypothetical protein